MLPTRTGDDCNDCVPAYLNNSTSFGTKAVSTTPFIATFALLTIIAYRKVYPLLQSQYASSHDAGKTLPRPATSGPEPTTQQVARRIAALTFSSTIALSAVLTELLLCEISNSFNPTARSIALQITVASLLGLLVVAIPLLGISSAVSKSGYKFHGAQQGRLRLAWVLEVAGYTAFLFGFWAIGAILPESTTIAESLKDQNSLFQACLDRLGITGVSLMALLSGFASVSAIWQTFGPRPRPVTEAEITRKQAGLDATIDMIAEKKSKLEHLGRKNLEVPNQGFWGRTVGSFRGNADSQEKQTLEMELNGLETMAASLESTINILRVRRSDQLRATTKMGRLSLGLSTIFAIYCVYRICMTGFNVTRRIFSRGPSSPSSETDPVTYTIALFARHIYPSLDQESWAQQISFLLSGAMLLASFSAVTQTFHLFSRFMPSAVHATKTNFALLISQISGMYVISSALMLRGMMPKEVGSVINSALGAGLLEPAWVQRWFEGFFFLAVLATAAGIFLGRQISGLATWDDDTGWDGGVELGKRS